MNPNVVLPFASSLLSFVLFVFLIDQWRERRRPYQLAWAVGMLWYGVSAGTEFLGGAFGWSEPLYRAWYPYRAFARRAGQPQTVKAAMDARGWRGGGVRAPLIDLLPEQRAELHAIVTAVLDRASAAGRAASVSNAA